MPPKKVHPSILIPDVAYLIFLGNRTPNGLDIMYMTLNIKAYLSPY